MDTFYSFSLTFTTLFCLAYLKDTNLRPCISLLVIKIINVSIINILSISPYCELLLFILLDLMLLLVVTENHMKTTILTDLLSLLTTIMYPATYQPINEFDICVCSNLYCISINTEKRYWLFLPNITLFIILIFSRYNLA